MIEQGGIVHSEIVCGWWLDTGKREDLLAANRILLDELTNRIIKGRVDARSTVTGRADIDENTDIINSIIKGPVSIAGNCIIKDSTIHPFTSIGPGSVIENSSLEATIVVGNSRISNVSQIKDSVIGMHTEVTGHAGKKEAAVIFAGSHTKIRL